MVKLHARELISPITKWASLIPQEEWLVYQSVIDEAQSRKIPFAVGGAFAVATYTGYWRNTKDLDLYVLPQDRDRMLDVVRSLGLHDYYDVKPYDRWWIFRAHAGNTIVDLIWAMANHRAQIDDLWLSGPEVEVHGRTLRVLPGEALLWDKLYIMQRDRCDWPEVFNLLYFIGAKVDWQYLLYRMGDDTPLMAGALTVFRWIAPGYAAKLPEWIWERLNVPRPEPVAQPDIDSRRVSLLDTRPWFGHDRGKLQPC